MDALNIKYEMTEQKRASLSQVFSEKRGQIRNFIRKRIRDLSLVEDLLQDVFAQLVNTYDDIESVDAWLYTVARNRINDYYRKKKTESLDDMYTDSNGEDTLANLLPDIADGPDQVYLREAIWEEVMDVLEGLPSEQAEAFAMHELDSYSIKEIAEKQEVSVNTVLSRKRYAVNALKNRLEHFYDELYD
jgi:RNA polymerase sigma factor (sigma-70 family)